jgi:hypothetical protein
MSYFQTTVKPLSRRARMAGNLAIATLLFIVIAEPFLNLAAGIVAGRVSAANAVRG